MASKIILMIANTNHCGIIGAMMGGHQECTRLPDSMLAFSPHKNNS